MMGAMVGRLIYWGLSCIFSSNKSQLEKNLFNTALRSFILSSATFICKYLSSSFSFLSFTIAYSSSSCFNSPSYCLMVLSELVMSVFNNAYLEASWERWWLRWVDWCQSYESLYEIIMFMYLDLYSQCFYFSTCSASYAYSFCDMVSVSISVSFYLIFSGSAFWSTSYNFYSC